MEQKTGVFCQIDVQEFHLWSKIRTEASYISYKTKQKIKKLIFYLHTLSVLTRCATSRPTSLVLAAAWL
jgi:hypothetical protein